MRRQLLIVSLSGFIISSLTFLVTCCVTNSETNRSALILVSDGQMNELGKQSYRQILESEKLSKNLRHTRILKRVGAHIAKASDQDFNWEFKLIEDKKTVNAFCLPGGKIAVYTGILPIAKNEAGLAAILGHEVAHASLRHGAERISQNIAAQVGLSLAGLSLSDSKYRKLIFAGLGVGVNLGVLMPFSRHHESEADKVGLIYMAKAGYDPTEAVGLWLRMAKANETSTPEILSTHPDPEKRSRALRQQLSSVAKYYKQSVKRTNQSL